MRSSILYILSHTSLDTQLKFDCIYTS